jgi:hypothetical protein
LSQFDPRVLEQHLPRRDGDDRKARRSNVVERGGLARNLAGLDQPIFGIAPTNWSFIAPLYGIAEANTPMPASKRGHRAADFGAEGQGNGLADPTFAPQPIPQYDVRHLRGDQHPPAPAGEPCPAACYRCRRTREFEWLSLIVSSLMSRKP